MSTFSHRRSGAWRAHGSVSLCDVLTKLQ